MGPGEWCDAFFSLELAHPWKVGAFLFPTPGLPLKKSELWNQERMVGIEKESRSPQGRREDKAQT